MNQLTPRQQDIARLVARGYSTPQIARALSLSEQTVKNYLADTYATFGWTNDAGNQRVLLALHVWEQEQGQNPRTNAENLVQLDQSKRADALLATASPALTIRSDTPEGDR